MDLTQRLDDTTHVVDEADPPADPFERADVLDAALRLGHSVMALAERIVQREHEYRAATTLGERLDRVHLEDRQPYAPPPPPPPPTKPPPPPPPPPGGDR